MDWTALLAAFGGGMWGASIGAVPAFIFTGILAIVGGVAALTGHTEMIGVAFGPVFGPHVSFGGGVAAAAFAGSRGFLDTGRDIGTPLMGLKRVDVLFVGGAFGSLGYLINAGLALAGAGNWTDTIALTVILTAMRDPPGLRQDVADRDRRESRPALSPGRFREVGGVAAGPVARAVHRPCRGTDGGLSGFGERVEGRE